MAKARKKAKAARDGGVTEEEFLRDLDNRERGLVIQTANEIVEPYGIDRDPLHLLRGVLYVAEEGKPLNDAVIGWLRRAIEVLEKPPARKNKPPRRNAVRDLRVLRAIYIACSGNFPERLTDKLAGAIAKRERITMANVRMIASRHRAVKAGRSPR